MILRHAVLGSICLCAYMYATDIDISHTAESQAFSLFPIYFEKSTNCRVEISQSAAFGSISMLPLFGHLLTFIWSMTNKETQPYCIDHHNMLEMIIFVGACLNPVRVWVHTPFMFVKWSLLNFMIQYEAGTKIFGRYHNVQLWKTPPTPNHQLYLEDHPRTCKWLAALIYAPFRPFGRGTTWGTY